MRWDPGTVIVFRSLIGRHIGLELSGTIIHDGDDSLSVYIAPNAPAKRLAPETGSVLPRVMSPDQIANSLFRIIESRGPNRHILHVTPAGAPYSIYVQWSSVDWTFQGWYVNFQSPIVRRENGLETRDWYLDIVVDPSLDWQWCVSQSSRSRMLAVASKGRVLFLRWGNTHWPLKSWSVLHLVEDGLVRQWLDQS